jgi:O-antigen/teichoic acid export membrane protein
MTAAFALSHVSAGVAVLLASIVVARAFGAHAFGEWTLAMVWAATLSACVDLGFGVLITRETAAHRDRARGLVAAAMTARLAALVPLAAVFWAAAPWLGLPDGRPMIRAGALALAAASAVYGCVAAALRTTPRWLVATVAIETGGSLLLLAGAWAIVAVGGAIDHVLVAAAVGQAAQGLIAAVLLRRAFGVDGRITRATRGRVVSAVRDAWPLAAAGLVANAQVRMAPLALGALTSPAAVAWFAAAWRLASAARVIPHAALGGALPVLAAERGRASADEHETAAALEWALALFATACTLALAFAAGPLLTATYGPGFGDARLALVWLALGLVPGLMNAGRRVAMTAAGAEQAALAWSAVAFLVQAMCCAAWIPAYGAAGAAAALTAGEAAVWWPLQRTRARMPHRSNLRHA